MDVMTLDELITYRAVLEVYGTSSELYEVNAQILKLKETQNGHN